MNASYSPRKVIWTVLLLAPVLGELLSTSSPPMEFFRPVSFVMLVALYGVGALLCREAMVRTGSGWRGQMWLGAAYGILEEAVICQSWFNTAWPDLGALAEFGRYLGVSWVWAVHLTVFHSAISIGITLLIVDLMYPSAAAKRLLSERAWRIMLGVFLLTVILLHLGFSAAYRAPWTHLLGGLALAGACIALGTRPRQRDLSGQPIGHPVAPFTLGVVGASTSWSLFLFGFTTPHLGLSAPVAIALYLALAAFWAYWLVRLTGYGRNWTQTGKAALTAGVLSFPTFVCLVAERMPRRDNPTGLSLVGWAAIVLLTLLIRYARWQDARAAEAITPHV